MNAAAAARVTLRLASAIHTRLGKYITPDIGVYRGWENSCAVFRLPSRGSAAFHSPSLWSGPLQRSRTPIGRALIPALRCGRIWSEHQRVHATVAASLCQRAERRLSDQREGENGDIPTAFSLPAPTGRCNRADNPMAC
jgi:hypothetical protein